LLHSRALSAAEIAAVYAAGGRAPCSGSDSRRFSVDTAAPETQITTGPADGSTIDVRSATFRWTGTDDQTPAPELQFAAWLDDVLIRDDSPSTTIELTGLTEGSHTFRVRSRDLAGNVDTTAAQRTFNVSALPPAIAIVSGPGLFYGSTSGTF